MYRNVVVSKPGRVAVYSESHKTLGRIRANGGAHFYRIRGGCHPDQQLKWSQVLEGRQSSSVINFRGWPRGRIGGIRMERDVVGWLTSLETRS